MALPLRDGGCHFPERGHAALQFLPAIVEERRHFLLVHPLPQLGLFCPARNPPRPFLIQRQHLEQPNPPSEAAPCTVDAPTRFKDLLPRCLWLAQRRRLARQERSWLSATGAKLPHQSL